MSDNVQPTVDPNIAKMLETIDAGAKQMREKAMTDFTTGFQAELAKMLSPDRSTVAKIHDEKPKRDTVPALEAMRVTDPRGFMYERMKRTDPEMAVYRSSDSDHWSREWIMGMTFNDHARSQRANDEIAKIFGRATILEGTTTAVSGLSQGEGGFLIPLPLAGAIALHLSRSAKIRSLAKVETSSAKTLRVPVSLAATAQMQTENAVAAQGEPDLTSVLLDKKKMQAQFGVSKETLRDSAFDLSGFFAERAGSAFGQLEDVEICVGSGTPTVTQTIIAGVTDVLEASPTVLTYADLVTLWFTLPEQYQANATWLCGSVVAGLLSRLMISGGIAPALVQANPSVTIGDGANVQGFIFGRPVIVVPLASGGLYVGDIMRQYSILDDGGIESESSMHVGWDTDTVRWKFTRRFDGAGIINDAARRMAGLASIA